MAKQIKKSGNSGVSVKKVSKSGESFSDFIFSPFHQWYEYIKENVKDCYVGLLKINLAGFFVSMAALLGFTIIAVVAYFGLNAAGALTNAASNLLLIGALIAYIIIALFVTVWLSSAFKYTAILFVKSQLDGGDFSIMGAFNDIKGKVFKFIIANGLVRVALLIPGALVIGVFLALGGGFATLSNAAGLFWVQMFFAYLLFILYAAVVLLIFNIFAQFWTYNYLLDNKGILDSLKKSVSMVKIRLPQAIAFGIVLWIGAVFLSIPGAIYSYIGQFAIQLVSSLISIGGGVLFMGLFVVMVLIHLLIILVFSTIVECLTQPTEYLFWKKMKEPVKQ